MRLTVDRDSLGTLTIRQTSVPVLRYVIGVPLLLFGGVMAAGAVSSVVTQVSDDGVAALPLALVGAGMLLFFAALILPLGWWLVLSRHAVVVEAGPRDVVEVSDWRIGRKANRTPADRFRAVRVALEPVASSAGNDGRGGRALCLRVRLLARQPDVQPSLEIGMLEPGDRQEAAIVAGRVAEVLRLPVESGGPDEVLPDPQKAADDAEAEAQAERDEA
ncbi:MAG: hypothetical protein R2745_09175 [Vicinamibacterales bacterium]